VTRPKGLLLLSLCWPAMAETSLDALRTELLRMRGTPAELGAPRRATAQLTVIKHGLRDWIESRLSTLAERGDEGASARKLNNELRDAGLFCGVGSTCPDWTRMGFLEEIRLSRSGIFLILQTGIGIDQCGFDESAYLYSWSTEGWKRVWQTEQNIYTEKDYKPQLLHAVLISPYNRSNDYLVLTLGSNPWCTSNWQPLYYRVFRPSPDLESKPLINGDEIAFGPADVQGSITSDEVLVEFHIQSIDTSVLVRAAVRHYKIERDQVNRIDPLALSPRDFVDEWLTHDWKEASFWSEDANRRAMLQQHTKLHKDLVFGEFQYPTMHCPQAPDLWQVGVDFTQTPPTKGAEPEADYFLVRWRPPYHFTMVNVTDQASSACNEEDRAADEGRTLFPLRR
jgi:hypothetical protein